MKPNFGAAGPNFGGAGPNTGAADPNPRAAEPRIGPAEPNFGEPRDLKPSSSERGGQKATQTMTHKNINQKGGQEPRKTRKCAMKTS